MADVILTGITVASGLRRVVDTTGRQMTAQG